jgi:hypothetical protein
VVFLRWGIFGIIAVAALIYAYNALGHLADRRKLPPAAEVAPLARGLNEQPLARRLNEQPPAPDPAPEQQPPAGETRTTAVRVEPGIPPRCAIELDIARRAAESHSIGEPLDRVLRIQEIAWQKDEKLRARYTQIATRWYGEPGPVDAGRLHRDVVAACVDATP